MNLRLNLSKSSLRKPSPKLATIRLPHLNRAAMSKVNLSNGQKIIIGLVVLLLILHQDNWFWDDDTLLLGFLPIGLFWHACISIAATLTWALATKIAWPLDQEGKGT